MRRALGVAALAMVCSLSSCRGLIYTHIVRPLDVNLTETPVFNSLPAKGDVKRIRYYVDLEWDSNGLGDVAKKAGMTQIYYADMETLSILGVWTQSFVHVYGR